MITLILDRTSQTVNITPSYDQPASATWVIEDLSQSIGGGDREVASGSASVLSWSATTTAVAGPATLNARKVTLDSAAGITIGDDAILVADDGSREIVRIEAISTSPAYVLVSGGVFGEYAIGSTLTGLGLTVSIPDALSTNPDYYTQQRPLRLAITYTVGGRTYRETESIEWARADQQDIPLADLLNSIRTLYPDIVSRLPDNADFDAMVNECIRMAQDDLRVRSIDPGTLHLAGLAVPFYRRRVIYHAATLGYSPGGNDDLAVWLISAEREYRAYLEHLVIGRPGLGVITTSHDQNEIASKPPELSGVILTM